MRAFAAAAAATVAAATSSSKQQQAAASSSKQRLQQPLQQRLLEATLSWQQRLLAATPARSRACLCNSARFQQPLFAAPLAYRSACLPQRLQQQHCTASCTPTGSSSNTLYAVVAVVRDVHQQLQQHLSAAAAGSRAGMQPQRQQISRNPAGIRHGPRSRSGQAWPLQSVRKVFGQQNAAVKSHILQI